MDVSVCLITKWPSTTQSEVKVGSQQHMDSTSQTTSRPCNLRLVVESLIVRQGSIHLRRLKQNNSTKSLIVKLQAHRKCIRGRRNESTISPSLKSITPLRILLTSVKAHWLVLERRSLITLLQSPVSTFTAKIPFQSK